tara:strand:+ start:941 stop:1612 length:672 start_codon:yes stop_codon:yes gene_type:complete
LPVITNPYRFAVVTEFDSMYESFNPLTTINKQHFVEWFSGSSLPSYWTTTLVSGTVSMSDSVDGGIKLSTSGVNQKATIHFNDKKQYAHDGSVLLSVFKFDSTQASTIQSIGFTDNNKSDGARTSGANSAGFSDVVNQGTIYVDHGDGSGAVINTNSGVTADTNWHVGKITLDGSSLITQIDGVAIGSTITTDIPTARLQPIAHIDSGVTKNLHINYMECYNT